MELRNRPRVLRMSESLNRQSKVMRKESKFSTFPYLGLSGRGVLLHFFFISSIPDPLTILELLIVELEVFISSFLIDYSFLISLKLPYMKELVSKRRKYLPVPWTTECLHNSFTSINSYSYPSLLKLPSWLALNFLLSYLRSLLSLLLVDLRAPNLSTLNPWTLES